METDTSTFYKHDTAGTDYARYKSYFDDVAVVLPAESKASEKQSPDCVRNMRGEGFR